uniref:Uncharacterized protein n=1 Tax=Leersia perrieri TaxID=77586 RepID=A0A0D9XHY1_9ORYZ
RAAVVDKRSGRPAEYKTAGVCFRSEWERTGCWTFVLWRPTSRDLIASVHDHPSFHQFPRRCRRRARTRQCRHHATPPPTPPTTYPRGSGAAAYHRSDRLLPPPSKPSTRRSPSSPTPSPNLIYSTWLEFAGEDEDASRGTAVTKTYDAWRRSALSVRRSYYDAHQSTNRTQSSSFHVQLPIFTRNQPEPQRCL